MEDVVRTILKKYGIVDEKAVKEIVGVLDREVRKRYILTVSKMFQKPLYAYHLEKNIAVKKC